MAREVVLEAFRRRRRRLQAHNVSCIRTLHVDIVQEASCGVLETLTCVLNQTQPAGFYYEIV